jgi:uncharacterized membrane protein
MEIFSYPAGWSLIARVVHILAGIMWIGLLYYFNFVQGPFLNAVDADVKGVATRTLVPRALAWFRYAALLTFLAGVALILIRLDAQGPDTFSGSIGLSILMGMSLGTLMFLNVWGVIWPKQKVVIASAEAVAAGGQADPQATGAARRALLTSRTNVVFSIPMLFFMATGAGHLSLFGAASGTDLALFAIISGAVVAAFELNALVGTAGIAKQPLEKIGPTITTGVILLALIYLILQLFT